MPVAALSAPIKLGIMLGTVVLAGVLITFSVHRGTQDQNGKSSGSTTCPAGANGKTCSGLGDCVSGACVCNPGYSGTDCSVSNKPCPTAVSPDAPAGTKASQCAGNGTCVNGTCACNAGWSGDTCTTAIPACPSYQGNLCNGHGTCDGTTCNCDAGWKGLACQYEDDGNTCPMGYNAGGTLEECSGRATCTGGVCGTCSGGFTGDACQIPNSTCPSDPGGNLCGGNGTCDTGTGECTCNPGFKGYACDIPVPANTLTGDLCSTFDATTGELSTYATKGHEHGAIDFDVTTQTVSCVCNPGADSTDPACSGCASGHQPGTLPLPSGAGDPAWTDATWEGQCVLACPGTTANYTCSGNGTCTQGKCVCASTSDYGGIEVTGDDCSRVTRMSSYTSFPSSAKECAPAGGVPPPSIKEGQPLLDGNTEYAPEAGTINMSTFDAPNSCFYWPSPCPGYVEAGDIPDLPAGVSNSYLLNRYCFGKGTCRSDGTCDFSASEGVDESSDGRFCAAGYQGIVQGADWTSKGPEDTGTTWDVGPCMPCIFTDNTGTCISTCEATDWDNIYPAGPSGPASPKWSVPPGTNVATAMDQAYPGSESQNFYVRDLTWDEAPFGTLWGLNDGDPDTTGIYVQLYDHTANEHAQYAVATLSVPDPTNRGANPPPDTALGGWLTDQVSFTIANPAHHYIHGKASNLAANKAAAAFLLSIISNGTGTYTLGWRVYRGTDIEEADWNAAIAATEQSDGAVPTLYNKRCGQNADACNTTFAPIFKPGTGEPANGGVASFVPCTCSYDYQQAGSPPNTFCDILQANCCAQHARDVLNTDTSVTAPCGPAGAWEKGNPKVGCIGVYTDPKTGKQMNAECSWTDAEKSEVGARFDCTCDAGFANTGGPGNACQACDTSSTGNPDAKLITRRGTGADLPFTATDTWQSKTVASIKKPGTNSGCCVNWCAERQAEGLCGMRDGCGGTCPGDSHCAQVGGCLGHRGSGKVVCGAEEKCCKQTDGYGCTEYSTDSDPSNEGGFCMFKKYCGVKTKCVWLRCGPPTGGKTPLAITYRNHPGKNSSGNAEADGCPPAHSCFHGSARVTMADGSLKAARDVQAGDMVMAADGTPTKVLFNDEQAGGRYVVAVNDIPYPFVTASHPWYAPDGDSRIIVDVATSEAHRAYATTVPMQVGVSSVVWKGLDGAAHVPTKVESLRPYYIPEEVVVYDILTEAHTLIVEGFAFWDEMPELSRDPAATAVVLHITDYINKHLYDWEAFDTEKVENEPAARAYRHALVDAVAQATGPMVNLALTGVHLSADSEPVGFENWDDADKADIHAVLKDLGERLDGVADPVATRRLMQVGSTTWGVFYGLARKMSRLCTASQFRFLLSRIEQDLSEEAGWIKDTKNEVAHIERWQSDLQAQRRSIQVMG